MINENQKKTTDEYRKRFDMIDWSVGKAYKERQASPASKLTVSMISSKKPHISKNAAVHRDQVKDFNRQCVQGCHYEPGTGNLISRSANARQKEAKRRGLYFN